MKISLFKSEAVTVTKNQTNVIQFLCNCLLLDKHVLEYLGIGFVALIYFDTDQTMLYFLLFVNF